jgi:hypothetical protein
MRRSWPPLCLPSPSQPGSSITRCSLRTRKSRSIIWRSPRPKPSHIRETAPDGPGSRRSRPSTSGLRRVQNPRGSDSTPHPPAWSPRPRPFPHSPLGAAIDSGFISRSAPRASRVVGDSFSRRSPSGSGVKPKRSIRRVTGTRRLACSMRVQPSTAGARESSGTRRRGAFALKAARSSPVVGSSSSTERARRAHGSTAMKIARPGS